MRLYQRRPGGVYHVEFRLPGGQLCRHSTHQKEQRAAHGAALALQEAATRQWSRQEDLFASRDNYSWERATLDFNAERMHAGLSLATIEIDGQNQKALAAAADGHGVPFFAGRLVRDIDGARINDYVTQQQALGLTVETIGKRLGTLRQIMQSARARRGTDGRQLLGEIPPIPSLGRSRDPDGWGRALTRAEADAFLLALPTTGTRATCSHSGKGAGGRPGKVVDQRGWATVCLWTAMHTADVNTFTPDRFNLTADRGPPPHQLPPKSFLWTNSKNRHRTKGKVREQTRGLTPELADTLARLVRDRGASELLPIAGVWTQGNIWRDMQAAARRAGLAEIIDDRGDPHLVSPNDLRRTAATWLAEALIEYGSGPDRSAIELIAEFLGHRGLDVARRIYDRAAGTRLDVVTDILSRVQGERRGPRRATGEASEIVRFRKREG